MSDERAMIRRTAPSRWRTAVTAHAAARLHTGLGWISPALYGLHIWQSGPDTTLSLASSALALTLIRIASCWRRTTPANEHTATDTIGTDRVYPEAGIWHF